VYSNLYLSVNVLTADTIKLVSMFTYAAGYASSHRTLASALPCECVRMTGYNPSLPAGKANLRATHPLPGLAYFILHHRPIPEATAMSTRRTCTLHGQIFFFFIDARPTFPESSVPFSFPMRS